MEKFLILQRPFLHQVSAGILFCSYGLIIAKNVLILNKQNSLRYEENESVIYN